MSSGCGGQVAFQHFPPHHGTWLCRSAGACVALLCGITLGCVARFQPRITHVLTAAGVVHVTADEEGSFSAAIDLEALSVPPGTGDSVSFDAVWIGPTRERLTAQGTTKIQYSEHVVSLTVSASNDQLTPQQEFSIVLEVDSASSVPAAASVTVRLSPGDYLHCNLYNRIGRWRGKP